MEVAVPAVEVAMVKNGFSVGIEVLPAIAREPQGVVVPIPSL